MHFSKSMQGKRIYGCSASLVMPNSYPHDEIFNQHQTTIKDFYDNSDVQSLHAMLSMTSVKWYWAIKLSGW